MNRGLLINCTHEYTLRLLPAFIVTSKQIREFLGIFEEVLGHVSKSMAATETARPAAHSAAR
jgi:acetylornithine/succinyldiaminopimelate/putrescine aminotransferase